MVQVVLQEMFTIATPLCRVTLNDSTLLPRVVAARHPVVYAESRLPVLRTGVCVPGRGVLSISVHGPSSANRTA